MRLFTLSTWLRALMLSLLLLAGAGVAHAQARHVNNMTATPEEVAAAIRASPNANEWLRAHADDIGRLSTFESGGRLSVYNGSCCYGILQMNTSNIWEFAGVSPEVFRTWSLQDQVNAWSRLTVQAMGAGSVRQLQRMEAAGQTFDGRPVDAFLQLACIQLGVGNCQTMIRSGKCSGFADKNGTTICRMADAMSGGRSGISSGYEDGSVSTRPIASFECRRNADGSCMSVSEAMRAAFHEGSGVEMETLRKVLRILLMGTALLAAGSGTLTAWQSYAKGAIAMPAMVGYVKRATLLTLTVVVILSFM